MGLLSTDTEALKARLKPLIRERTLNLADIPDLLQFAALYANADPSIQAHLAEVEERVQLTLPQIPPEQWFWIVMDRGHFSSGRGAIDPTLSVEFADEKTLLGIFIGTINPQMALFTGKLKATPIARALALAEFFEVVNSSTGAT